jgi:hypothetical protein
MLAGLESCLDDQVLGQNLRSFIDCVIRGLNTYLYSYTYYLYHSVISRSVCAIDSNE